MLQKKHKHKSCCWLFKLETGVGTIIYLDIMMFGLILLTSFASMRYILQSEINTSPGAVKKTGRRSNDYFLFNIVTDYTLVLVMLIKMYYAIIYGWKLVHKGSIDEEFLFDDQG